MTSSNLECEPTCELGVASRNGVLRYIVLGGFAVIAMLVILLSRAGLSPLVNNHPGTHPSDAALELVFEQHEADFNQLIAMSNIDAKVVRIAPDFTWLDDNAGWPRPESELGFSKERWNQYRQLFEELGLKKGLGRDANGTVEFIASSHGLLTNGSGKGYIYSNKELSPLYASLDDSPLTHGKYVYKALQAPRWYLFYYSK
jgi:hypothetical protein